MASAVESVARILAILPLLVRRIDAFRVGLEPYKPWARYCKDLRELRLVLEVHVAKLLNTFERLLSPLVSESQLASLLSDLGGRQWSSPSLRLDLQRLLRTSYPPFLSALGQFKDALAGLQEKFEATLHVDVRHRCRSPSLTCPNR